MRPMLTLLGSERLPCGRTDDGNGFRLDVVRLQDEGGAHLQQNGRLVLHRRCPEVDPKAVSADVHNEDVATIGIDRSHTLGRSTCRDGSAAIRPGSTGNYADNNRHPTSNSLYKQSTIRTDVGHLLTAIGALKGHNYRVAILYWVALIGDALNMLALNVVSHRLPQYPQDRNSSLVGRVTHRECIVLIGDPHLLRP